MKVIWSENDCDAIEKFIDHVLVGFNAVITPREFNVVMEPRLDGPINVLVGGHTYDAGYGGLLTVFGQLLDENFDLVQPRRHVWIEWDAIETLEVH